MTYDVDEILAKELSKIGGFLSGLVARRMPNNVGELHEILDAPVEAVLNIAELYFSEQGNAIFNRIISRDDKQLIGICGGGSLNMNPVFIAITVKQILENKTEITVTCTAKEGLIKQFAGEKTAKSISEFIINNLT